MAEPSVRWWDHVSTVVSSQNGRSASIGVPPANFSGSSVGTLGSTFAANPWDIVFLGVDPPDPLPGKCEIMKASYARKYDPKKGAATNGSNSVLLGYDCKPIQIKCTVWTNDQWGELLKILKKIIPPPGKKSANAINVVHPALAAIGITQMVIIEVDAPKPDGKAHGAYSITIDGMEFRKDDKKKAKDPITAAIKTKILPIAGELAPAFRQVAGIFAAASFGAIHADNEPRPKPGKDSSFTKPRT